jgi:hypothetical protein
MRTRKTVLILRTCPHTMTSYDGSFRWPESGPVEDPDWDPKPKCGGGLHGLLWGEGPAAALFTDTLSRPDVTSYKWIVFRALASEVVVFDGICKARRGTVEYCGDKDGAIQYLLEHGAEGRAVVFRYLIASDHEKSTVGDYGTAISGEHGTAKAGNFGTAIAGDHGTALSGYHGHSITGDFGMSIADKYGIARTMKQGRAEAGFYGIAVAGGQGSATAGNHGKAIAGVFGMATAGDYGHAIVDCYGAAKAGMGGTISIHYNDGENYKVRHAKVGEDGVEPYTFYQLNEKLEFVRI